MKKKFYYFPNHGDEDGNNSFTIAFGNEDDDLLLASGPTIVGAEDNEDDAIEACKRLNSIIQPLDYIGQVAEFHATFEHPIGTGPSHVEPLNIRQLRIKLLFEELCELAEASDCMVTIGELCTDKIEDMASCEGGYVDGDNVDKLEELDALCDIQYVLSGKILTSGLHTVFNKNFARVHQNNMNKAHFSMEHAEETLNRTLKGKGTIAQKPLMTTGSKLHVGESVFIVLNEDKKVIKPWDHRKVELTLDEDEL